MKMQNAAFIALEICSIFSVVVLSFWFLMCNFDL